VQRAIAAYFEAEPDNAFLLSELCERIYPRINRIEKKHRVAVARAAKLIPTLAVMKRETLGSELVFYDPLNVMSYAMARLKVDFLNGGYRNNDPRKARIRERCAWLARRNPQKYGYLADGGSYRETTEQELREMLASERYLKLVVEGGTWWRHTEIERSKRRGDLDTYNRLQADEQAELKAILATPILARASAVLSDNALTPSDKVTA
jgi:hypothetical protein